MQRTRPDVPYAAQVRENLRQAYADFEGDVVSAAEEACDELEGDLRLLLAVGYHAVYCCAGLQSWEHLSERINALMGLADRSRMLRERRADAVALDLSRQDALGKGGG